MQLGARNTVVQDGIWNKNNLNRKMVESRVYFNNFYLFGVVRTTIQIQIRMTTIEIS